MNKAQVYFTKNITAISIAVIAVIFSFNVFATEVQAAIGVYEKINFQGKLVNTNGTNVANGDYTIVFTLYDASSGGTNLWDETQTVTVTDGVFQVHLGDVDSTISSVDFNTDTLYLGVKVGADSEMTPRIRYTAVPYAFMAEKVNGLTVTNNGSNTLNIAAGKTFTASNTITIAGTDSTSFTFPSTGGNVVTEAFAQSLTNKTIGSTGLTFSGASIDITTASNEDLTITPNGSGNIVLTGDFDSQVLIGASSVTTEFGLFVNNSIGSNASFVVNNINSSDLISASSSGTTKFNVTNAGIIQIAASQALDTLTAGALGIGTTTANALTLGNNTVSSMTFNVDTAGNFVFQKEGSAYTCSGTDKLTLNGSGQMVCGADQNSGGSGSSSWTLTTANGTISPNNGTVDLLLGFGSNAPATSSAKFSVLNLAGTLTPVASISAIGGSDDTKGVYLSGNGSIQSVRNNTLTLGGATTGNIVLSPNNGAGILTFNSGGESVWTNTSGNLTIQTATSGTMTIDSAGALNLGTTNSTSTSLGKAATTLTINPTSWTATPTISGLVTGTLGFSAAASQSYTGAGAVTFSSGANGLLTLTPNGTANTVISSDFDSGTTIGTAITGEFPLLVRSGIGNNAALAIDNLNSGDLFTASVSGVTKFTIDSTGTITTGIWGGTAFTDASVSDTLTSSLFVGSGSTTTAIDLATAEVGGVLPIANGGSNKNLTLSNGGIVWTDADSFEVLAAAGGAGSCLLSGGAATPSWGSCAAGGGSNWDITAGAITPKLTSTLDLLLGSQATISAKFGFLNVNSGTPTASISANANSNATYLAGSGSLQSVRNNTLTLGGDTTGNIAISPNNGGAGSLLTVNAINQTWSGTTTLTASSLATLTSAATLGVSATTLTFGGDSAATLSTVADDNLTLTANGTGDLRILSDTDTDILFPEAAFITEDNSLLYTGAAGKLFALTSTTAGQCVVSAAANNAPTWATCPGGGGGSSNWTLSTTNGTISPNNGTVDLLLGFGASTASTASAKFSVTNLAGALSPTASLSATTDSGGNGNGLVFNTSGNNAAIQALRNNTLTIGGGTTGNIVLRSGEGIVFIGENEVKNGGLTFYSSGAGIADPTIIVDASGNLTIQATQAGASVIVGDGSGNISLSLTAAADGLIADKTVTLAGTYTGDDFTFKRIFTGGANTQSGSILNIQDISGGSGTINGDLLLVNSALTSGNFIGNLGAFQQNSVTKLTIQGSGTSPVVKITGLTSSAGLIVDNAGVGDLFTASASGATKFTLSNTGSASMSGGLTLDSAASIQTTKHQTLTIGGNTTGNIFLQANNSSTGKVQVGTGNGGTTTPDLFGLDVKSDTGDPTGFEGAMYYNTSDNKFRCYEGAAWANCVTSLSTESVTDNTPLADLPNGVGAIAEIMNSAEPVITPDASSSRILVTGFLKLMGDGTDDETSTFSVWRDSADDTSCDGTQVGVDFVAFNTGAATDEWWIPFNFIDSPAGTSAVYYSVCGYTSTATTPNGIDVASITIQEIAATGADLAELYATNDESLEAGDVVSLDPTLDSGVKKSTKSYASDIIGIVSTAPALVIGSIADPRVRAVPIALSGRVPVKVSTENGDIKAGDYLTASSIPGVAMKATKAGTIIGQAMESYSGQEVGKVLAFVKTSFSQGDTKDVSSLEYLISNKDSIKTEDLSGIFTDRVVAGLEIITPSVIAQEVSLESIRAYEGKDITLNLSADGSFILKDNAGKDTIRFDSEGNATFAGVITADKIRANQIEGLEFSIRNEVLNLKDILGVNSASSSAGISGLSQDLGNISSEPEGAIEKFQAIFRGLVEFVGQVIFRDNVEFQGEVAFNSDTAGYAEIKKGQKFVEVVFEKEYVNQPVVNASVAISNLSEESFKKYIDEGFCEELEGIEVCQDKITDLILNGSIEHAVKNQTPKGFVIFLSDQAPTDMTFSWQATAVKDVKTTLNDGPAGLVLPFVGDYQPSNKFGEHSLDPKIKDKDSRVGLKGHDGLDIALPWGSDVLAVADGEVEIENNDYGTTIYIKHAWGKTVYGHLSERLVEVGDKVAKGQKIALSGNSGLTTGPHLHFGLTLNKSKQDNGYAGFENPWHYLSFRGLTPESSAVAGASDQVSPTPSKTPKPTVEPVSPEIKNNEVNLQGLEGLSLN